MEYETHAFVPLNNFEIIIFDIFVRKLYDSSTEFCVNHQCGVDMSARTKERRERIVALAKQDGFVSVVALAELFRVSEVTIRSDLDVLESQDLLARTHGGAYCSDQRRHSHKSGLPGRIERVASGAMALIDDYDAIMIEGGVAGQALAHYLHERRGLMVYSDAIDIAMQLTNSPHTIALLGGVITDGRSIGWPDINQFLAPGVRARCLFLSGLEHDEIGRDVAVRRETLRRRMMDVCDQVVLMVDSSELAEAVKRDQLSELERITRIITDDAVDSATIARLAGSGVPMTICGTGGRRNVENMPIRRWRIGFANQDERLPFPAAVRTGMLAAAELAGVDLLLADNRSDGDIAYANAESFIKAQVDLAVIFNTDARANNKIIEALRQANIPVIAIDIPIPGATFFGFDNYRAGLMTGRLLGQYVRRQWHGVVDAVFSLGLPISGPVPAARMQGQIDGLREQIAVPDSRIIHLDSRNTSVDSCAATRIAIKKIRRSDRVVILGINDEATLGAISAFAEDGSLARCVTVGLGGDVEALRELRRSGSRMIGVVASFPERYGERVIEMACAILQRRAAPPARYTNHCYVLSDETMRLLDLTALRGSVVSATEYSAQRRGV